MEEKNKIGGFSAVISAVLAKNTAIGDINIY